MIFYPKCKLIYLRLMQEVILKKMVPVRICQRNIRQKSHGLFPSVHYPVTQAERLEIFLFIETLKY